MKNHKPYLMRVCLICLLAAGMVHAKNVTTSNIPGIDSIPAAKSSTDQDENRGTSTTSDVIDDKQAPRRDNKKVSTITQDNPDKIETIGDISLPLITNLKTTISTQRKHSVKIEWQVSPKNTTAIYVARYLRPVDSRALVLDADVVSSPPLEANASSYIDYNIPDGTYYYVVVTSYEMSSKERLKLVSGQNYTSSPMVIYRHDTQSEVVNTKYQIQGLYAVNQKGSVSLSWVPANKSDIDYNVYKSYQPFTGPESLDYAKKMATVDSRQLQYMDNEPIANRLTYYLVSVVDKSTNKEHTVFEVDKTFISNTYTEQSIGIDKLKLIPSSLTTYLKNKDSIQLLWNDPEVRVPEMSIYRSNRPISSVDFFRSAVLIGHSPYGTKSFLDSGLKPGNYYYAVLPKREQNKLIGIFAPNKTFTVLPVRIYSKSNTTDSNQTTTDNSENTQTNTTTTTTTIDNNENKTSDSRLSLFKAKRISRYGIKLSWEVNTGDSDQDFHFLIYRSTSPVESFDELQRDAEFVTELGGAERSYKDKVEKNGRYYYAIVMDFDGKVSHSMIVGRNYLRKPVVIDSSSVDNTETDDKHSDHSKHNHIIRPDQNQKNVYTMAELNRVLANTYHQNRFSLALKKIEPFRNSKHSKADVRAKATLYTGLSWYNLGRYRVAMEYFLNEGVQAHYPQRSRFWYKRCIEKAK